MVDKFPGPRVTVTRLKSQLAQSTTVFMSATEYHRFYFYSSFMTNTKHIFFLLLSKIELFLDLIAM